ncbi:MAG TPA: hypothetical protein VJ841_02520 [Candidatus Saccharimonadales bacterium]|nr:hypothetical protein [Candidatus Saccharimonadales bacterium]
MKVFETPPAHLLSEKPHPLRDECAQCAEAGWNQAYYAGDLKGNRISVAEGYGKLAGYILVAKGHLIDRPHTVKEGEFRSPEIERTAYRSDEYEFHLA